MASLIRKSLSFILINYIIVISLINSTSSVIVPPRLAASDPPPLTNQTSYSLKDDEQPNYSLTIREGNELNVIIKSHVEITVNLNRAVPQDLNVTIKVISEPDMIGFESNNTSNNSSDASITISYPANVFGDKVVKFQTKEKAGHAQIVCTINNQPANLSIDDSSAYISINIAKNKVLSMFIIIVGWLYFAAWSVSFYFQVILNYQRKSVVGLNFDFLALNLLGFSCYSIYNFSLMFSREVQQDYHEVHPHSIIPVEYNDLFFSLHAVVLTFVTIFQCFIYEVSYLYYDKIRLFFDNCLTEFPKLEKQRAEQKVSIPAGSFIGTSLVVGVGLHIAYLLNKLSILQVMLYLSYVKLAVTIIKYTPQAYMNYSRKATTGWSIHNILLDFTGGILSITQMFFLAINYDDWISIFGNFTKFGLGLISMLFDILFVVQHYILYRQQGNLEDSTESIPSPIISESVRSNNRAQESKSETSDQPEDDNTSQVQNMI